MESQFHNSKYRYVGVFTRNVVREMLHHASSDLRIVSLPHKASVNPKLCHYIVYLKM